MQKLLAGQRACAVMGQSVLSVYEMWLAKKKKVCATVFIVEMKNSRSVVPCSRPLLAPHGHVCLCLFRSELLSLLKTYNCYHEGRSFQLRHREVRPTICFARRVIPRFGLWGLLVSRCHSQGSSKAWPPHAPRVPAWFLSAFLARTQVTGRQGGAEVSL